MPLFEVENVSIYNSRIAKPDETVTKERRTELFELELPLDYGGIAYIDARSAQITPHLLICAKPNQLRHTKFPLKCRYVHLSVSDESVRRMLDSVPDFITVGDRSPYLALFEELQQWFTSSEPIGTLMVERLILKLIGMLYTEQTYATGTRSGSTVQRAIAYIKDNLSADLTLESVAAQVAISPIHFHNCFKAVTGKTLHCYVEEMRLQKAVDLMLDTDLTLTEIAFACGFSSQSYFNCVFKRKMQMTPRKYVQAVNDRYADGRGRREGCVSFSFKKEKDQKKI